eukprot:m.71954 g.71954  ORF g.71954 m.71954 type:complete len:489 (+) comp24408_c0_seq4:437-1903(+)
MASDGTNNMVTSFLIAASSKTVKAGSRIPEVSLCFDNSIFRGVRSNKSSAVDLRAFTSPNLPALANNTAIGINVNLALVRQPRPNFPIRYHPHMSGAKVSVLWLYPGITSSIIEAILGSGESRLDGLVIQSFGIGNGPSSCDILRVLKCATGTQTTGTDCGNEKRVIIVDTTQTGNGAVQADYATGLQGAGVWGSVDMTIEAAFTKLTYLLTVTPALSYETIKQNWQRDFCGELTTTPTPHQAIFKLRGMLPEGDYVHSEQDFQSHIVAPTSVAITRAEGQGGGVYYVPQYHATVANPPPTSYTPATDCEGCFMSYKFQPNNNCYNYACDVATNSFAQPGRKSGYLLSPAVKSDPSFENWAQTVQRFAEYDGLVVIGKEYPTKEKLEDETGHVVALVIAAPTTVNGVAWPGDYHWVRYDKVNKAWSQKDGGDQMTNFDFAGKPITDPSTANWQVNEPMPTSKKQNVDMFVAYKFAVFMFVPTGKVNII